MLSSDSNILRSSIPVVIPTERTVGEYVWHKLNSFDDNNVCLIDAYTGQQLTVGQLKHQSLSIGRALVAKGVTKSDKIAFYGHNSIQHSVLRFAAYFLGLPFCPLSPTFGAYEVGHEYRSTGATIIMTTNDDLPKFKDVIDNTDNNTVNVVKLVVIFDGQHKDYLTYDQLLIDDGANDGQSLLAARVPYFDVDPDNDPFIYIHTSGSTGSPKCVKLKHQSILILMHERGHFLDPDIVSSPGALKKHCIAFPYPFGHISGSAILPLQLCMGYPLVIYSQFDEHLLFKSVETYRITFLGTFPSFGRRLVDPDVFSRYDMSSLQIVNTGGAAFPGNVARDIIDKYNVIFREGYGMTEYLFITAGRNIADEFKSGNCGPVSPGTECKVADLATGQPLGPNSDGELCVRGLKLFAGYVNNDRAFGEAFDSDGWYRTGDIGHYDPSGNIYITDRLKEIIRVADGNLYVNVSPVEIEQFLLTHPSIAEAAVVGVNNRSGTQWPRAYVKLNSGQTTVVSDIDIKKFVADTLAYTKQLKGGVQFVDNIKRINIGKVDRKFYRNMV